MQTHADVMALWPTAQALADDLPADLGGAAVRHWKREGRIPAHRFDDVISAAKKRGFKGVTYPLLAGAVR